MQNLSQELLDYLNGICCPEPVVTYNFDVTGDWAGVPTPGPVTDLSSFQAWVLHDSPNAVISNFVKNGNRIQANVTNFIFMDFENRGVTDIQAIPNTLTYLNIAVNSLSTASLDIVSENLLTNNVLENFNSSVQSTSAQPSSANQTALSALCTANGGSATF